MPKALLSASQEPARHLRRVVGKGRRDGLIAERFHLLARDERVGGVAREGAFRSFPRAVADRHARDGDVPAEQQRRLLSRALGARIRAAWIGPILLRVAAG